MTIHSFDGIVTERKQLTEDVIIISLKIPEDFNFQAGQFVTIFLTKDGKKLPRSYSILNPPSQKGQLDLCIKIVKEGYASEIFNKVKEGDTFPIKGPLGHFIYDQKDKNTDIYFLGAGTGITPFYSMIKEHLPKTKKNFTLLFGVRKEKNLFLNEEWVTLAKKYPNFTYQPVLSKQQWSGKTGHVQDHLPKDCKNKTFYICGLKELVLETKELLAQLGVEPSNIKSERYS